MNFLNVKHAAAAALIGLGLSGVVSPALAEIGDYEFQLVQTEIKKGDSAIVAESFDEQDEGMRRILKMAVEGAKRNQRHSGICGQAPSDHIEVARYLVELGIDSISLTPDRVLKTMQVVQEIEAARSN